MAKIERSRQTAEIEGDFVVFLIGMRINKLWKVWSWLPVMAAMPRMLIELSKHQELGLMHYRTHFGIRNVLVVQYWRSFEALHAYSTDKTREHLPAWKRFNQKVAGTGDVGIWHETYLIPEGQYENVYGGMPPYGMGLAGTLHEAKGRRQSARGRLRQTDGQDLPDMDAETVGH